jgi:hypothetical protein
MRDTIEQTELAGRYRHRQSIAIYSTTINAYQGTHHQPCIAQYHQDNHDSRNRCTLSATYVHSQSTNRSYPSRHEPCSYDTNDNQPADYVHYENYSR